MMLLKKTYKKLAVSLLAIFSVQTVSATEEFYVPFPEDQTLNFLTNISSRPLCPAGSLVEQANAPNPANPINTVTDFVVRVDGTIIVIDHREDGYELADLESIAAGTGTASSATTRVFGDGDLSNGAAPGVTTNADDRLVAGQVVVFEESVTVSAAGLAEIEVIGQPAAGGGLRTTDGIDGGDRIFATETINVTRAQWAGTFVPPTSGESGTLFAGAFELFPLSQWGQSFTLPVGENSGAPEFEWTGVTIMAANDSTLVSIDVNGDGDFTDPGDVSTTLNRGQSFEVLGNNDDGGQTGQGLFQGARIITSDIVQVNVISGQECSNYAARWFTLFPDALLGNNYYEPVSTPAGAETQIYLYNPANRAITINYETSAGMQTPISVPARGVATQIIPSDSGARFFTDNVIDSFGALTVTDINGGTLGTTHDWGHASTSQRLMGNIVQVGFAEGDDPSSDDSITGGDGENGSPVWLIADNLDDPSDTEIDVCVDVSGDGGASTDPNTGLQFDYQVRLNRLESARLYDGGRNSPNNVPAHIDGDQSGMLVFVCDGSSSILAAAWGQDPSEASLGRPAIDLGTTVRSVSADVAFIGDTVFEDINSNGVRDPNEPGIQGVTLILTPAAGINLGNGPGQPITTSTDFNGSYLFSGLVSGPYTIEVVPPTGFTQTFDPDASNGESVVLDNISRPVIIDAIGRLDQDFGYNNSVPAGQLGDFVFTDVNGNGLQDLGEPGISGVDVELCTLSAPTVIASDTFNTVSFNNNAAQWSGPWVELGDNNAAGSATNENTGFGAVDGFSMTVFGQSLSIRGNNNTATGPSLTRQFNPSSFENDLTVTLQIRANSSTALYEPEDQLFIQVSTDGGGSFNTVGTISAVSLNSGGTFPVNFNFDSQGASDVRLRLQVNGNNISGAEAEALEVDNLSISGRTEVCQTQTTNASGNYLFTGLTPGTYRTTVLNPPAGLVNTVDPSGDADNTNEIVLNSSGGNLDQDYGYFTPATVIGHVYFDVNGNGIQDVGEPNIAGLNVQVTDSNGNLQTVVTDANGDYTAQVPPGSALVKLDESDPDFPAGFIQTDGVDPNTVVAVAGAIADAGDDGFFRANSIGDTVYSEVDGVLGAQGSVDFGLPNLRVTLTPVGGIDLGNGPNQPISTLTDANGEYEFVGLPDGDYLVTVTPPSSATQTQDPDGGNDNQAIVSVSGGENNVLQDFGYQSLVPTGQVGDRIYNDVNGDGIQDSSELGIGGIDVEICGDLDDSDATANTCLLDTTDASGNYLFTGLPATGAGEVYTVRVLNPPSGQQNSDDPDGGLPNFSQLTLAANAGNLDQDFGYFVPAEINGHLYFDSNGDGTQQAGEPDLVNVDVIITDANGNQQTVSTDDNGDYVALVAPGTATVDIDETDPQFPSNVTQTEGTDPSTVNAVAGANVSAGIDGFAPSGSIGDQIFFDNSANGSLGVFDAGIDSGIPSVLVTLTPPAGIDAGNGAGVPVTTLTDANGNYLFQGLPAATYTIAVDAPSGAQPTTDPNEAGVCSTCDNTSSVTLTAGGADLVQDFGYSNAICPVGAVSFDEYPLATNNSTTIIDDEYATGGLGNTNSPLAPGMGFTVSAVGGENLAVFYNTTPRLVSGNDPDLEFSNTGNALIVQEAGNTGGVGDGGFIPDDQSSGGQLIFSYETPLTEFRATLVDMEGVASTLTFTNTVTGVSVSVRHDQIAPGLATSVPEFEQDPATCPGLGDTQVCVMTNGITAAELSAFAGVSLQSFNRVEYFKQASGGIDNISITYDCSTESVIGNRIFEDINANGIQDPGEPGIPGIDVQICGDLDNDDSTIATCRIETTDAQGDYLFGDNLTADRLTADAADNPLPITTGTEDYTIEVLNPPVGFINTADPDGGVANVSQLTLPSPLPNLDQDFGYNQSAAVGDLIFYDFNGDGIFNGNDEGIPGVLVRLEQPNITTVLASDSFSPRAYNNNAGDWAGPWVEVNDIGGPTGGDIEISAGGQLLLGEGGGTTLNDTLIRPIDVTGLNTELEFQFDLAAATNVGAGDTLEIIYIVNGVETVLETITTVSGGGFGAGTRTFTTPNTGSATTVELGFRVSGVNGAEQVVIDNVEVSSVTGGVRETVTNADGIYGFSNVPAGNNTITVDPNNNTLPATRINATAPTADPDGGADNTSTFPLASGGENLEQDFGYQPNLIRGTVFEDTSGDGVGNNPLSGVTVQLYSDPNGDGDPSDGVLVATVTTDDSGNYQFERTVAGVGIPQDDYVVVEIDPAGMRSVSDADTTPDAGGDALNEPAPLGNLDNQLPVSIGAGEVDADNNFVDTRVGSIAGRVWLDEDLDGIQDTEEVGLTGVIVELKDINGVVLERQVTDANGNYLFADLTGGGYQVDVLDSSIPSGLDNTAGIGGLDPKIVELASGQRVRNVDFGYIPDDPTEGAIGDRVWADADGDGIQDPGEAGISDVVLSLRDANGAVIATTTTNENGDYLFTNVAFGDDFTVTIDNTGGPLAGFSPTVGPQSEGGFISNPVTLTATNPTVTELDFGFDRSGLNTLTDTFWFDADADGVFDGDENPISGVTVNLYNDANNDGIPDDIDNDGQPEVVATTVSDSDGNVTFTGLTDGNYIVAVTDNGQALEGLDPTTVPAVNQQSPTATLAGGVVVDRDSFGYNNPGLISGVVYNDENANAGQDSGEAGTSGQTVTLLRDIDGDGVYETTVTSTQTGADGSYQFDGLEPGDYRVVVTPPGGTQTEDVDSAIDGQTDISLAVGESSVNNDFGYTGNPDLYNISGTVFLDPAKNGVEDAGDPGIEGITLQLTSPASGILGFDIIDGMVDLNGNGGIDAFDDGVVEGVAVIDGMFDTNGDGEITEADTGPVGPYDTLEGMINLAESGAASQSSNFNTSLIAGQANDSVTTGFSIAHTADQPNSWWQIDLGSVQSIGTVKIFNRDDCCQDRLNGVVVLVSDTPFDVSADGPANFSAAVANADAQTTIVTSTGDETLDFGGVSGRYIRLQKNGVSNVTGIINIAEVKVSPAFIAASEQVVSATTTTDADGNYQFTGLPNGDYTVSVTDEAALLTGFDITSGLDVLDASIDSADVTDVDFGYIREESTASLSGTVWVDEESADVPFNNAPDDNELRLGGVDVYLCRAPLLPAGSGFPAVTDDLLRFERFDITPAGTISSVSQIRTLGTVTDTTPQSSIGITAGNQNDFGQIYRGFITLPESGEYNFRTRSDDGSVLLIGGEEIVNNDALQAPTTVTGQVTLEAGVYPIEIQYFERGGGQALSAEFSLPSAPATFNSIGSATLSTVSDFCDPLHPNFVASTTTDANGDYSFNGLPSGQYVTDSDPDDIPEGLDNSVDPAPVNVSEGEDVRDVNIGYRPDAGTGALSGFVWVDANGDGIAQPGEAPIGGVTIEVRSTQGITDGTGTVLFTTTTRPDGTWSVTDISGADLQDGFLINYVQADIDTQSGLNLNETQPTNLPLGDFNYFPVDLASDPDNNISFIDFGFQPPSDSAGSLAGTIYTDVDQDGDYSPGVDNELEGVSLNLINAAGEVIATTTTVPSFIDPVTGDERNYVFSGLPSGDYRVVITDNQNVIQDLNPAEVISNPSTIDVTNPALRNVIDRDAGFVSDTRLRSIGNRFFFDINGDGIADDNEPGIAGIVVQCWLDADNSEVPNDPTVPSSDQQPEPGIDNLIRTVTTDESGEYYCTSLPEGQYIVTVADAQGFVEAQDSTLITGNAGDNFAKPWTYVVSQSATGAPNFTADFGVAGANTLSGTIFVEDEDLVEPAGVGIGAGELDGVAGGPSPDTSNNGVDDPVVANIPVDLFVQQPNGDFTLIQSTTTGPDGEYSFSGLPDGNYRVVVRPDGTGINGYGQTGDPDLEAVALGSGNDADRVCDSSTAALCDDQTGTPIDVDSAGGSGSGVNVTGVDFGYQRNFTTTPVTMNSFEATREGDIVKFVWETSNEVGHAGFQLYARGTDGWNLISPELIQSLPGQALEVRSYEFQASTDATWFALVDVSTGEEVNPHGPFRVGQSYGASDAGSESFDWGKLTLPEPANDDDYNSIEDILRGVELDDEERAERALSN